MSSCSVSPTITASAGGHAEQFEDAQEDRLVRFRLAVRVGGQHRVGVEAVVGDELVEVRDEFESRPI